MSRSSSSLKVRGAPRPRRKGAPLSPAGGCNSRDAHCASYANRTTTALSVQALTWVFDHSEATLGDRLVMLVIADHARADGTGAWPSVETIAREAKVSERTVTRSFARLVELGEIVERGKSRAGTKVWDLPKMGVTSATERGDNLSVEGGQDVTRSVLEPSVETPLTPLRGDVQQVYDHWRTARKRTRAAYATCSSARRRKIEQRLREFTVAELVAAIDAVALDDWKDRPKHDDLTVIFRSREQVERFLELADTTPGGGKRVPAIDRAVEFAKRFGVEYPTSQSLLDELEVRFPSLSEHERRRVAAMRSAA